MGHEGSSKAGPSTDVDREVKMYMDKMLGQMGSRGSGPEVEMLGPLMLLLAQAPSLLCSVPACSLQSWTRPFIFEADSTALDIC